MMQTKFPPQTESQFEICCECGQSVAWGSGKFVNRIPSVSTPDERRDMGMPYPSGEWICGECDDARQEGEDQ